MAVESQGRLHELLGHGTGRIMVEAEEHEGRFNFDIDEPLTGHPITS